MEGITHLKGVLSLEEIRGLVSWLDTLKFQWVSFKVFGRQVYLGPQIIHLTTTIKSVVPFDAKVVVMDLGKNLQYIEPLINVVKQRLPFIAEKELKQVTLMKYPSDILRKTGLHRDRQEVSRNGSVVNFNLGATSVFRIKEAPIRKKSIEDSRLFLQADYVLENGDLIARHQVQHLYKHGLVKAVSGRYAVQLRYS